MNYRAKSTTLVVEGVEELGTLCQGNILFLSSASFSYTFQNVSEKIAYQHKQHNIDLYVVL